MNTRIGLLGGTFDPIHYGHLHLASGAYRELSLDKLLLVPSGVSYMKENVSDAAHRLRMTELAAEEYPYLSVSRVEIDRQGDSYSYETIRELKAAGTRCS